MKWPSFTPSSRQTCQEPSPVLSLKMKTPSWTMCFSLVFNSMSSDLDGMKTFLTGQWCWGNWPQDLLVLPGDLRQQAQRKAQVLVISMTVDHTATHCVLALCISYKLPTVCYLRNTNGSLVYYGILNMDLTLLSYSCYMQTRGRNEKQTPKTYLQKLQFWGGMSRVPWASLTFRQTNWGIFATGLRDNPFLLLCHT